MITIMDRDLSPAGSLGLNVGRADHLGPLLSLGGDEITEVGRRARKHQELVMPGLVPGIHVVAVSPQERRGWRVIGEQKRRVLRTAKPGQDEETVNRASSPVGLHWLP